MAYLPPIVPGKPVPQSSTSGAPVKTGKFVPAGSFLPPLPKSNNPGYVAPKTTPVKQTKPAPQQQQQQPNLLQQAQGVAGTIATGANIFANAVKGIFTPAGGKPQPVHQPPPPKITITPQQKSAIGSLKPGQVLPDFSPSQVAGMSPTLQGQPPNSKTKNHAPVKPNIIDTFLKDNPTIAEPIREATTSLTQGADAVGQLIANVWNPTKQNPNMRKVVEGALKYFTPAARLQLSQVPTIDANMEKGKGFTVTGQQSPEGMFGSKITVPAGNDNPLDDRKVAVHELLHATVNARGARGINWDSFMQDYTKATEQDPDLEKHMISFVKGESARYQSLGSSMPPEEIFAEVGAYYKGHVFETSMGKYYKGILNNPNEKPSLVNQAVSGVENALPDTAATIKSIVQDVWNLGAKPTPLAKDIVQTVSTPGAQTPANIKKTMTDLWTVIKPTIDQEQKNIQNFFTAKTPTARVAAGTQSIAGAGNVVFSPISALFGAAQSVPILGTAAKIITLPFALAGDAGKDYADQRLSQMHLPPQALAQIKPGVEAMYQLGAQLVVGHLGDMAGVKQDLTNKFGEKDAQTIIDQAQRMEQSYNKGVVQRVTSGKASPQEINQYQTLAKAGRLREFTQAGHAGFLSENAGVGTMEFTPEQAQGAIVGSDLENTPVGNTIIKESLNAKQTGQNVEVTIAKGHEGEMKTPGGVTITNIQSVEPSTAATRVQSGKPIEEPVTKNQTPSAPTGNPKTVTLTTPENFPGIREATASVTPDNVGTIHVQMSQEATGMPAEREAVQQLENQLQAKGVPTVHVTVPTEAVPMWKELGYAPVQGGTLTEGRVSMTKNLTPFHPHHGAPTRELSTEETMQAAREHGVPVMTLRRTPEQIKEEGKPRIGAKDLQTIIRNSPDFKRNPVLTVEKSGHLTFSEGRIHFSIPASAMNLDTEGIKPGDKIIVDEKSLKGAGSQVQLTHRTQEIADYVNQLKAAQKEPGTIVQATKLLEIADKLSQPTPIIEKATSDIMQKFVDTPFKEGLAMLKDLSNNYGGEWTVLYDKIKSGEVTQSDYEQAQNRYTESKTATQTGKGTALGLSGEGEGRIQTRQDNYPEGPGTQVDQVEPSLPEESQFEDNATGRGSAVEQFTGEGKPEGIDTGIGNGIDNNPEGNKPVNEGGNGLKGYASKGTSSIGTFEKLPETDSEAKNFKLFKEVQTLTKKYAKRIGEGYLPRGTAGVFYPTTENIRINGMNDLSVAAHEITHFLDQKGQISKQLMEQTGTTSKGAPIYDTKTATLRKEMTELFSNYYPTGRTDAPLKTRMVEGYATLLQKYVEMPTTIAGHYPNLVKEFLQPEGKYYQPVIGEIIDDLRSIVSKYQGLSSLDKIGARVTSENNPIVKSSYFNFGDKFRDIFVDNIWKQEKLNKLAGTGRSTSDYSLWMRMAPNYSAIYAQNVMGNRGYYSYRDGDFVKTNDKNWGDLIKTLGKEKQTDAFGYYLVARDQHFNWQTLDKLREEYMAHRGRVSSVLARLQEMNANPDLYTEDDFKEIERQATGLKKQVEESKKAYEDQHKVLTNNGFTRGEIDQAYEENKDRFPGEEKLFDKLVHESLAFAAHPDVQLVKPEQYKELSGKQGYASMKRQIYDELVGDKEQGTGTMQVGGTRISSMIQRRGGSNTIINPLYNALSNESEILRKGLKQIIYNKIGELAHKGTFPDLFQPTQLKTAIESNGSVHFPQEKDTNIVMSRRNFSRDPILVDAKEKKMIDEILTPASMHIIDRVLTASNRLFTHGTTGFYTPFALTNFIRHQVDATAQSQNGYIPLYNPLKTLTNLLVRQGSKEAKWGLEYMTLGGTRQTLVGWQDKSPDELLKHVTGEKNGLVKAIDLMDKGMNILAIPAKYSEVLTRMGEYIKSRQKGNPQIVALEDAGRLDAPFHHMGSWGGSRGRQAIRTIAFFNADLQYADMAVRSMENPKTRGRYIFTTLAITAGIIAGSQMILRFGTPNQKQAYKDLQPNDLARYLWLPNSNGKDLIKLPMPQQMTLPATIINMMIAQSVLNANYQVGDFIQGAGAILPNPLNITNITRLLTTYIPQIIKPAVEVAFGVKDYPTILPIVPQSLQNLPPAQQYNKNTSPVAIELGKLLNFSPLKIDYLITGYLGRASQFGTGNLTSINPLGGVTQQQYLAGGRTVNNFYNTKIANDQNYSAIVKGTSKFTPEQTDQIIKNHITDFRTGQLLTQYRNVDMVKDPQGAAKLQQQILDGIKNRGQLQGVKEQASYKRAQIKTGVIAEPASKKGGKKAAYNPGPAYKP